MLGALEIAMGRGLGLVLRALLRGGMALGLVFGGGVVVGGGGLGFGLLGIRLLGRGFPSLFSPVSCKGIAMV